MADDASGGWDAVAEDFVALRSAVGAEIVRGWAALLPSGGAVLDIGCGSGVPIGEVLAGMGFALFGVDASPTLLAMFARRFPDARTACEAAECSDFFGRRFDAAVAIGLVFLLPEAGQRALIARVGKALVPGGRFLFSAPEMACEWDDRLTGQRSMSLGAVAYRALLGGAGMQVADGLVDAGGNHYFDAVAGGV